MTGPTAAFEGKHGVWEQVTGPFQLGKLGGAGEPFGIERSNLKFFPAEYHSQAPLWVAIELRKKVRPEDIESIAIQTYYTAWSEIGSEPEKWNPQTRETADHSLPYLFALGLVDGAIRADSFSEERIRDPRLRQLMPKITIAENKDYTREFPGEAHVALRGEDGERADAGGDRVLSQGAREEPDERRRRREQVRGADGRVVEARPARRARARAARSRQGSRCRQRAGARARR